MDILGLSISGLLASALLEELEKKNQEKEPEPEAQPDEEKKEVVWTEKTMTIEGVGRVKFYRPTEKIEKEADDFYRSSFDRFVKSGMKTKSAIEQELKASGVINDQTEKEKKELRQAIANALAHLSGPGASEERKRLADEIREMRKKLFGHIDQSAWHYQDSAESAAEKEKWFFIIQKCTFSDKTQQLLWDTLEKLKKDAAEKEEKVIRVVMEYMCFVHKTDEFMPDIRNLVKYRQKK